MKAISLKQARERAGLTQDELAEAAGIAQSVISRLESRESPRPEFNTVLKLAKALGRSPESLRFGRAANAA